MSGFSIHQPIPWQRINRKPGKYLPQPVRGSKAKGTEPINQTIKNESIMAILVNPIQRPNPLDKDAAKKWYVVQVTVDSAI